MAISVKSLASKTLLFWIDVAGQLTVSLRQALHDRVMCAWPRLQGCPGHCGVHSTNLLQVHDGGVLLHVGLQMFLTP
jgi:hypothetical protein